MSPFLYVSFGFVFGWLGARICDLIILAINKRKQKKNKPPEVVEDKDVVS